MVDLTYNPAIFDVADLDSARRIILTAGPDLGTEERWERETPYLADLAADRLKLTPDKLLLDYGCGVGRLARAIIEKTGCQVIGVDISAVMRGMAPTYVSDPRFSVVSRNVFDGMVRRGLRVDAALAVWVLQHCRTPATDVGLILRSMTVSAQLLVVNALNRAVPVVEKTWAADGINIQELLDSKAVTLARGVLDAESVGPHSAANSFWSLSSNKP